jgi:hypothetical protein
MRLLTYRPGPPLSRFVELLWIYESAGEPHAAERLLPDGTAELVIDLRDTVERGVLIGPRSAPCEIGTAEPTAVMGAHFRPGGAFPFLKQPTSELHCVVIPPEDVWRARARDLREQLTPKLYCRLTRFQHALRRLERGESKLARLALDCGYHDQAHFNHDFRTFSGASPSVFLARWAGRPNHLPA